MACLNHADALEGLHPCTRCGKTYCGDCLVELKGGRFCAGCKTEEVKDRQSGVVTGDLDLAGVGQRFAAQFIDGLVFLVIWVPMFFIMGSAMASSGSREAAAAMMPIYLLVVFGLIFAYEAVFLTWKGQTLGKMALSIKVVGADGEALRGWQCCVRPLVRVAFSVIGYLAIINVLPGLLTKQKTCVHDMLARSRVVRLKR